MQPYAHTCCSSCRLRTGLPLTDAKVSHLSVTSCLCSVSHTFNCTTEHACSLTRATSTPRGVLACSCACAAVETTSLSHCRTPVAPTPPPATSRLSRARRGWWRWPGGIVEVASTPCPTRLAASALTRAAMLASAAAWVAGSERAAAAPRSPVSASGTEEAPLEAWLPGAGALPRRGPRPVEEVWGSMDSQSRRGRSTVAACGQGVCE